MSFQKDARLLGKVLTGRVPSRALLYAFLNMLHGMFRTGNRRYEFERVHLENGDHWGYFTSEYERAKYRHTLQRTLELRRGRKQALEVGCSVGAFTRMIAPEFDRITALEISQAALTIAVRHLEDAGNVTLVQGGLLSLDLREQFDVIFCAEVLYYLRAQDAARACQVLDHHLAENGLVILVSVITTSSGAIYAHGWDKILGSHFREVHKEVVEKVSRPYEIIAYERG